MRARTSVAEGCSETTRRGLPQRREDPEDEAVRFTLDAFSSGLCCRFSMLACIYVSSISQARAQPLLWHPVQQELQHLFAFLLAFLCFANFWQAGKNIRVDEADESWDPGDIQPEMGLPSRPPIRVGEVG